MTGTKVTAVKALDQMFMAETIKERVKSVVGGKKNMATFKSSLVQLVRQNDMLMGADPSTILSAAMMAATLNLPINNNLGFAYIVPFKNTRKGRVEAQFQIGWKGFVQLAIRTGEFKNMAVSKVYSDQLVSENPLTGYEFDWSKKPADDELPIGYVAYFRLLSGFEATNYMNRAEVEAHAKRYSKSYRQNKGQWVNDFDAMALKTSIKLLLSKFAPMSIEMQRAIESDQAIIGENGTPAYEDNILEQETEEVSQLRELASKIGKEELDLAKWISKGKTTKFSELDDIQSRKLKTEMNKRLLKVREESKIEVELEAEPEGDNVPF